MRYIIWNPSGSTLIAIGYGKHTLSLYLSLHHLELLASNNTDESRCISCPFRVRCLLQVLVLQMLCGSKLEVIEEDHSSAYITSLDHNAKYFGAGIKGSKENSI